MLVHDVTTRSVIYVSRAKGNNSASCGSVEFPCYSISWAVSQAQFGSCVFLDSTNTTTSPYDCQPLMSHFNGIYVTTALSFVGRPSLAHVSCRKGLNWTVNGTDSPIAIEVNFIGIAFQNTRVHLVETSVTATHCAFSNTENIAVNFTVLHQNRTSCLSFKNVNFESNDACISITSSSANTEDMRFISIHINNSVFKNNGLRRFPSLPSPSWTILGIDTSGTHFLNIQIMNSSFEGNYVCSSGTIFVKNKMGDTKFLMQDVVFMENGLQETKLAPNSLLVLKSATVFLTMSHSEVKKNKQRFLFIHSTLAEVNVSHTTVDDFINRQVHGGVFLIESHVMKLLIKNCFFSNGKSNPGHGGLLFVYANNASIFIKNSILTNLTTLGNGGVIYAAAWHFATAVMNINVTNSSFISNLASIGGVIFIDPKATIHTNNSKFIMKKAWWSNGFQWSFPVYLVNVFLQDSLFEANTAQAGGCVGVLDKHVQFILLGKNVIFTRNNAGGAGGVMRIDAGVTRISFQTPSSRKMSLGQNLEVLFL